AGQYPHPGDAGGTSRTPASIGFRQRRRVVPVFQLCIDGRHQVIDFAPFLHTLRSAGLSKWAAQLEPALPHLMSADRHGDLTRWTDALAALPDLPVNTIDLDRNSIRIAGADRLPQEQRDALAQTLMQLHPWRKGPFDIFGINIDTEWRSDWKWDRLKNQIAPLAGRKVLDVGCGSGYHCW